MRVRTMPDRETAQTRLAAALVTSGLMARYIDYARRAHPISMSRSESPEEVAETWAHDILAADRWLSGLFSLATHPSKEETVVEP